MFTSRRSPLRLQLDVRLEHFARGVILRMQTQVREDPRGGLAESHYRAVAQQVFGGRTVRRRGQRRSTVVLPEPLSPSNKVTFGRRGLGINFSLAVFTVPA